MTHDHPDDNDWSELFEYASEALDPRSRRAVEEHLGSCSLCRDELARIEETVSELDSATPLAGRGKLWGRIEAQLAPLAQPPAPPKPEQLQVWKSWQGTPAANGQLLVRGDEGEWEATTSPGVEVRHLYVPPDRSSATILVRMAPGASYPAHRHNGPEHCYVLEGDLQVGEEQMIAGDFQHSSPGSVHPIQSTRNGCLLFIVTSLEDEILA